MANPGIPIRPSQCTRCGWAVLPDPHTPGYWVDQRNGRFCGGNPQFPHLAVTQPARQGGWKVPAVIGGAVVAVLVVVGTALALVAHDGGKQTSTAGPSASSPAGRSDNSSPTRTPTPTPTPTKAPARGAPVRCDPKAPSGRLCFPKDVITGQKLIQNIERRQKWPCATKGRKISGDPYPVDDAGSCQGSNTVDQPYSVLGTIGYHTDDDKPDGTMTEVVISMSTAQRASKGQHTKLQDTVKIAPDIFDIAVANLWPNDKGWQREANEKYKQVFATCAKREGTTAHEPTAKTSLGYEVSCQPISKLVVGDNGDTVTTYVTTASIAAPYAPFEAN